MKRRWRFLAGLVAAACWSALFAAGSTAAGAGVRPWRPAVATVPAGFFVMGSGDGDIAFVAEMCAAERGPVESCEPEMFRDEMPAHRVYLDAFRIDTAEVSRRAFRRCVLNNRCAPSRIGATDERTGRPEQPVTGVTWMEAREYCEWTGGALPTEAQWERAARGSDGRRFPWGRVFNSRIANHGGPDGPDPIDGFRFAAPVDAFEAGASPYGLLNMAGNAWELTADRYAFDAYRGGVRVNPTGPEKGEGRVVRGGSWQSPAYALRVTQRGQIGPRESRADVGFRCAYAVR
jgi:formylglycine-generating enzyme required for sulfatase activity